MPILPFMLAAAVCLQAASPFAARERRGRELAQYAQASRRVFDHLEAQGIDPGALQLWFALPERGAWALLWGRMEAAETGDVFVATRGFRVEGERLRELGKAELSQRAARSQGLARALSRGLQTKTHWNLPWNPFVFREADGTHSVYLLPGNLNSELLLLGGELKLHYDDEGRVRLGREAVHARLLPVNLEKGKAGLHRHTDPEGPTETDVALAILHADRLEALVVDDGKGRAWRLDRSGRIRKEPLAEKSEQP